jgi:hypothetical protein
MMRLIVLSLLFLSPFFVNSQSLYDSETVSFSYSTNLIIEQINYPGCTFFAMEKLEDETKFSMNLSLIEGNDSRTINSIYSNSMNQIENSSISYKFYSKEEVVIDDKNAIKVTYSHQVRSYEIYVVQVLVKNNNRSFSFTFSFDGEKDVIESNKQAKELIKTIKLKL